MAKAALEAVPFGGVLATIVEDVSERRRARVSQTLAAAVSASPSPAEFGRRIQADERLADLLVEAVEAAARTSHEGKRIAMGRVVAAALADDADIDEAHLLMSALAGLEAPAFAVLARVAAAGADSDAALSIGREAPVPVVSALIRHGAVHRATLVGGGTAIHSISDFGLRLLEYVRAP